MSLLYLVYIYNIYNINGCQWSKIFSAPRKQPIRRHVDDELSAIVTMARQGDFFVLFGNAKGEVIAVFYVCAVCNGMERWAPLCPACGEAAEDRGRLSDYYDPYAPYRPIDDLKMTNGYNDLERHQCIHSIFCEQCGQSFVQAVQELALE